jgi:hypothetical protein
MRDIKSLILLIDYPHYHHHEISNMAMLTNSNVHWAKNVNEDLLEDFDV